MSSEIPSPIITKEKVMSGMEITVLTWHCCKCSKPIGEFSAMRAMEIHGKIICGGCAQRENPAYQEWLEDQKRIKEMQMGAV